MKPNDLRYVVAKADAERILAGQLEQVKARSSSAYGLHHATIRHFLDNMGGAAERTAGRLVLDEAGILRWMIEDAKRRSLKYAYQRFAVVSYYLRALVQAELIGTDLLGQFKIRHGNRSWSCIARAIQSSDPIAALAALEPPAPLPGPLDASIEPFIELARAMGKKYKHHLRILQDLNRFLISESVPSLQAVDTALLERWIGTMTCSPAVRVDKVRFVKRFFEHLRGAGMVEHNPVDVTLTCSARPLHTFRPFIFTQQQIAAILAEARRLPRSHSFPLRQQTCYAMLAILCALGLRHGEARRLRVCDVNFGKDTLFIDQTKFNKSRYVPFGPGVGRCLREYLEDRRGILPPLRDEDPFFVTSWRAPLSGSTLLRSFHTILGAIGITQPGRRPPRLHDLRHTFAVHRLLRWYREGVDVQQRLPWLSTFMGHVDIVSTQVYLTITADLLNEASTRFYQHCGRLIAGESQS
jgi:integrase/recombinase XerD